MGFSALDYAVLAVYLVGITIFGSRFRGSHRTVKDYFLGRRNTSWIVISLSIVATETSTLTLIGVPALAYTVYARPELGGSFTYLQVVAGYIVARFVISWLFIPAYFDGEMLTAYELLNRRFGAQAKHFAASLFLVMRALAEGVRVFAASLVLAAVLSASALHLPNLWLWSIVIVGVLTLVYTFEGGIAAVIWTDLVQLIIYIGGSLLAAYMLWRLVPGGWTAILADARASGKLHAISWSTDVTVPFTFWAGVAGLVIAAIFAAAMSNLSGSLNSLASTTVIDFYQPLVGGAVSDAQLLTLSRWLTAAWGVALIGIAVLARDWGSVFTVGLTIASIVYGPMLGAFLLGLLTTRVRQRDVMVAIALSLGVMIGVRLLTTLAWTWYVLLGAAICVAVGWAASSVETRGASRVAGRVGSHVG